jgi:lipid II:glycine glycyltransferase (peptidoglycan interpeptide bridge formation enzyme)
MEILITKDPGWLAKWDAFAMREPKCSHLMLATWNESFRSYGFDYEVVLAVAGGDIIGGFAGVIAKAAVFRFYVVPFGPVTSGERVELLGRLIDEVQIRARHHNCCYAHVTLPVSAEPSPHTYSKLPSIEALQSAGEGHRFKHVYSSNGLNWVDTDFPDEDALLQHFGPVTRRNIRASLRKGMTLVFLTTGAEIKAGYDLCLENARANGYALRDWDSFGNTLLKMVAEGSACFLAAVKDGDMKGAILLARGGHYNTYVLGGSKKERPDLLAGHFLQWHAIRHTWHSGLGGYNISLGGSPGVTALKNQYADRQIFFEKSKYHWVLRPFYFKLYRFAEGRLSRNKKLVSRMLKILRRK